MKTIKCRNRFKDKKDGKCGRILVVMTDLQLEMLKLDPEGGPIMRCPGCPKDQRWMKVVDKGNGIEFEVVDEPADTLPPEPEYANEEVYEQIG